MENDRYQLARAIGVGPEGIAYAATEAATSAAVTVHRLRVTAERASALTSRLKLISLAAGPGILKVHDQAMGEESVVVVERVEARLDASLLQGPLTREAALRLIQAIARTLAQAHRVGLHHGALAPSTVMLREGGEPVLDFVGALTTRFDPNPLEAFCLAPDLQPGEGADIYALGALLSVALSGKPPASPDATATAEDVGRRDLAQMLVRDMVDSEPAWRPAALEVAERIERLLAHTQDGVAEAPAAGELPARLGRFVLEEQIGAGAMGRVYRARDLLDGRAVALKVLDRGSRSAQAVRRFRKEARLLGEVKNPFIANLIEVNRDGGHHFMAVELVDGRDMHAVVTQRGPLPEAEALALVTDVARALIDVHARGIVHRDIKPGNILLVEGERPTLKLVDFGIARHVDQNESLELTEHGALIGTPLYMSPEQCRAEALDSRSDIYSLGCTLFEWVTGRPPFAGGNVELVYAQHLHEKPPRADALNPALSSGLAELIGRCLEKEPERRPDATGLLAEVDHLLQRDPVEIAAHPARPAGADGAITYEFRWELRSSPAALWAYVANTDRLNRAIGLGPVEESFRTFEGEVGRYGKSQAGGFDIAWREHPYEWVEGKKLGVMREFIEGPLKWLRSTVDLALRTGGGTLLVHTLQLEPRGIVGRAAAALEVGVRTKRALARTYRRIDELLQQQPTARATYADAFEEPFSLSSEQEQRLAAIERTVIAQGGDALVTARLGDFLRTAPEQEVARMRPLALAAHLGLDPEQMVTVCLLAAHQGALTAAWDLVCPACRVPAQVEQTLRNLKDHGSCEVCSIEFALDLATSVELVFSPHASIRGCDEKTYCLGSPGHAPHVVAQVRVAPGERFQLELALREGSYFLAGRGVDFTVPFKVQPGAAASRGELSLERGPGEGFPRLFGTGQQRVVIENDGDREQLVRIERAHGREDALTAARVATRPLFRRLFPLEVLAPGNWVNVSSLTLLMAEVARGFSQPVEGPVEFSERYALFKRLEEQVTEQGGAVVKIVGDGVVAVFNEPGSAVRAALRLGGDDLPLRASVHRGPAGAVTLNDRLDYFGHTVRQAAELLEYAAPRELVLSEAAANDPAVAQLLASRRDQCTVTTHEGVLCQHVPLQDATAHTPEGVRQTRSAQQSV